MSSKDRPTLHAPLDPNQNVVVLVPYHRPYRRYSFAIRRCLIFSTGILLLAAAFYLLYPSDPNVHLARLRLNQIHVHSAPIPLLDLSFSVTIKVQNRNFFSFYYDKLAVSVGYRGRELGFVTSQGGKVGARRSSYVDATLDLNGLQVIHDAFYLIQDLAQGVIPFDTISNVSGELGFFFFRIPIKGRVSCEVYVHVLNQTIVHQDCYV